MAPKKHREAAEHRRNTFRNPPRSTELKRHRAKKHIPWENLAEQPLSGENPEVGTGEDTEDVERGWRLMVIETDIYLVRNERKNWILL